MTASIEELGAIFDWDGVLVDSHDHHETAWQALADEIDERLPPGFFKATFGRRNAQVIAECTTWADPGDEERVLVLARRKEALYRESIRSDGIELLPGAVELLEALAEAGIPRAIGSSAPRANIDAALALLGLDEPFETIVTADDVTFGKPDPEVFLICARRMGRRPESCVVFEDAHAGLEAARRAAMKAVGVSTTHAAAALEAADLVVPDLASVNLQTLERLFR